MMLLEVGFGGGGGGVGPSREKERETLNEERNFRAPIEKEEGGGKDDRITKFSLARAGLEERGTLFYY